jgi:hypothetical protein
MRGVYENPIGSGIWWIHYYGYGKRHREKVGRKSDAIKLYQPRKADVVAGRKLPELRNSKVVTLSELIDDVPEFVAHHKDNRSYESKGEIVRKAQPTGRLSLQPGFSQSPMRDRLRQSRLRELAVPSQCVPVLLAVWATRAETPQNRIREGIQKFD